MPAPTPTLFDRVRARLTGAPADYYALRRHNARRLAVLEARQAAALARLQESVDLSDRLIDPADRWGDWAGAGLARQLTPIGTINDRRAGNDRPLLVSELDLRQMRAWSRALCEVNGFAIGFLNRLCEFVVGTGFDWQVVLRGPGTGAVATGVADRDGDGRPDVDPVVEACQQVLDDWRLANDWGGGCQDREYESCARWRRDGELFLRLFKGGPATEGLPVLRFVEPEQVGVPPGENPNGEWSWGIETDLDDVETRKNYFVRDMDGDGSNGRVVSADRILHLTANVDRAIKRGIPDFFAVHDDLERVRRLQRNLAEVAAIQASIAYVREHAPTTTAGQVTDLITAGADYSQRVRGVADRTQQVQWQEPGQVVDLSAGLKFTAGPASAASEAFISVTQAILRGVCARFGMPELVTADASNNNYASSLVAGGPFERAVGRLQQAFAGMQRDLARRVLRLAAEAGRLPAGVADRVDVTVTPPAVAIANKLEDEQVRKTQFDAGVLSAQTWMQQAGLDVKVETANRAAWQRQFAPPQQPPQPDDRQPQPARESAAGNWDEDKHPRDHGRFSSKPGSPGTTDPHPAAVAAADGIESKLPPDTPPGVAAKAKDLALTVAAKVYEKLVAATPALIQGMRALENVFDTPEDMQKFGYNPGFGTHHATGDPIAQATGVSAHIALNVASHVLSRAWLAVKKHLGESALTPDQMADAVVEFLTAALEPLGFPPPDRAAVLALIREKTGHA